MRRPLHLSIVSYPSRLDATLEAIAQALCRGAGAARVVERAQEPEDLRYLVRLWHFRARAVTTLDLIGHGAGGRLALGDALLFARHDGPGLAAIDALCPFLAPGATLRLLGCAVGGEGWADDAQAGPGLLAQLQRRLGPGRTVLAPDRPLFAADFGPRGLRARARHSLTAAPTPRRDTWPHARRVRQGAPTSASRPPSPSQPSAS